MSIGKSQAKSSLTGTSSDLEPSNLEPVDTIGLQNLAPMLKSYLEYKKKYPDHLLLFQVGDFYEFFFQDAETASRVLSIRLTSRNKDNPQSVPMCGVPIHALDNYLPKLLTEGFSCAIVSQKDKDSSENPYLEVITDKRNPSLLEASPKESKSSSKTAIQRELTRIITPGVRFEGEGLGSKQNNFLVAFKIGIRQNVGVSYIDVSTGHLRLVDLEELEDFSELLEILEPQEVILPSERTLVSICYQQIKKNLLSRSQGGSSSQKTKFNYRDFSAENFVSLEKRLQEYFPQGSWQGLDISNPSHEVVAATEALLDYLDEVSFVRGPKVFRVTTQTKNSFQVIDATTRKHLELTQTRADGDSKNSLIGHLDSTITSMGGRLFLETISSPLTNFEEINKRHEAVEELCQKQEELFALRKLFQGLRDLDRLCSRLANGLATGRDLVALRDTTLVLPQIKIVLRNLNIRLVDNLLHDFAEQFDALEDLALILRQALLDDPAARPSEGRVFRKEFNNEIEELVSLSENADESLVSLEERERQQTGISSLKIKFNNITGYFIEVSKIHTDKIPANYQRRQTLVNAERYISPELKEFENKVLSAKAKLLQVENELFLRLKQSVISFINRIEKVSRVVAQLDVLCSFANSALKNNFVRPNFTKNSAIIISGGRHPVIEQIIGAEKFTPNNLTLDNEDTKLEVGDRPCQYFAVLTGPNMGGKSTFLRQVAIIQLLAQAGSFVPAQKATLPIVDRIFTRIGVADDLVKGDSTFMIEMREAANIVKRATQSSLILVDEIGRGTATRDGLAISYAIAEWLITQTKAKTIYATHFHELNQLAELYQSVKCLSVGARTDGEQISFTHLIEEKPADKSYGIEVAHLAGFPLELLKRARELFNIFQETLGEDIFGKYPAVTKSITQNISGSSSLRESSAQRTTKETEFSSNQPSPDVQSSKEEMHSSIPTIHPNFSQVIESLKLIDINQLTPLEAMLELHKIHKLLVANK